MRFSERHPEARPSPPHRTDGHLGLGCIQRLAILALVVSVSSVGPWGCAVMQPLAPGEDVQLSDKQGLLILDIESDTAIESLWISRSHPLPTIQQGRQVWIVRLEAGQYRWRKLYIDNLFGGRSLRYELPDDDEYVFRVEAGKINYPGQLTIHRVRGFRMDGLGLWGPELVIRNRNRAGSTLRELRKTHPMLLRTHPLNYSGSTGDQFLQFFAESMRRLDVDPGPAAGTGDPDR